MSENLIKKYLSLPKFFAVHLADNRKAAFTLAEVLITLGIIGVVAAMTLPAVINNIHNKELESWFKKGYADLSQVIMNIYAEHGDYILSQGYSENEFAEILLQEIKDAKLCDDCRISVPDGDDDSWGTVTGEYKTYNNKIAADDFLDNKIIKLKDARRIFIDGRIISIDTNGFYKKPNRWGFDLFSFYILPNGKFLPMGSPETLFTNQNTYCSVASSNRSNGAACAYKALTEKDYFKNLPK